MLIIPNLNLIYETSPALVLMPLFGENFFNLIASINPEAVKLTGIFIFITTIPMAVLFVHHPADNNPGGQGGGGNPPQGGGNGGNPPQGNNGGNPPNGGEPSTPGTQGDGIPPTPEPPRPPVRPAPEPRPGAPSIPDDFG